MNDENAYEAWKRSRSGAEVEEGFANRVMKEIRRLQGPRETTPVGMRVLVRLLSNRYVAAAMLILALALAMARTGLLVAFILAMPE